MGVGVTVTLQDHEACHVSGGSDEIDSALALTAIPEHSAAKHSTRTRKLFVASEKTDGTVGVAGAFSTIEFGDGVTKYVHFSFPVPMDFSSGSKILLACISAGGTGNVRLASETLSGEAGQSYSTHALNKAVAAYAMTANHITFIDVSPASLVWVAGEMVGVKVTRTGADATDTINCTLRVLGLLYEYTADM